MAATIVALRPALETLVIRAANDPENVNAPNAQEEKAIQVPIPNLFKRHLPLLFAQLWSYTHIWSQIC